MKKLLPFAFLLLLGFSTGWSQCVPDTLTYPNPGFYPLPSAPLPTGTVGTAYGQVLTVNVPSDTTINLGALIGFPFPPVTVSIVNMTLGAANGLPPGITATNSPSTILGGNSGCIDISGTPTTSGQYVFNIPTTLTINVPASVPVIGGTQQSVPGQVPYNLEVQGVTAVTPGRTDGLTLLGAVPNPSHGATVIRFSISQVSDVRLEIIGIDGKVVHAAEQHDVIGEQRFRFDASAMAPGMYLYRLSDGAHRVVGKLVVD